MQKRSSPDGQRTDSLAADGPACRYQQARESQRLFLSYSRRDDEGFVRRLHGDLRRAGFAVWFDRECMPSRRLTFYQEIRDAIAVCDRLVLVIGPEAVRSDYVTHEWQFAYFVANKCVNPVVRLDGDDCDGFALLPDDLKDYDAPDFRDDEQYLATLKTLIRQLSDPLPPVGELVAVPELPPGYRADPERLKVLRDMLLIDLRTPSVVSGAMARVGLHGMGGIGKSVLANAVARHPMVIRAFRDNIFWLRLGQRPDVVDMQRWLACKLGGDGMFHDSRTGREQLRNLLAGRAVLLIIDNVWQRGHVEAFNVVGPLGRLLITTRDAGLLDALASRQHCFRVELPTQVEAEAMLASAVGVAPEELPREAVEIVVRCGRLPLALALCGGMVRAGARWESVLSALSGHHLPFLCDNHPSEEQHRNAWVAMDVSVSALPERRRERFTELAVFALDAPPTEAAVATLWGRTGGLQRHDTEGVLADFARRSLVQRTGGEIRLHDLLHSFAQSRVRRREGGSARLHRALVDAYWDLAPKGWASGPDDGYYLQNLCHHLVAADQVHLAVDLLCGLEWIEAKCQAGMVTDLQGDYRIVIAALPEVQEELTATRAREERMTRCEIDLVAYAQAWALRRRSAANGQPVAGDEPKPPEPLPSASPWSHEQIADEQLRIRRRSLWPLSSLAMPEAIMSYGGRLERLNAFLRFLADEETPLGRNCEPGKATRLAFNSAPDGIVRRSAAALVEGIKTPWFGRRWSPQARHNPTPALVRVLVGHARQVTACAILAGGRWALSGSEDRSLRLWEIETGVCIRTATGNVRKVSALAATPDGRRAVVADWRTIHLWDLETGTRMQSWRAHQAGIESIAVTPDGALVLSASRDETLRLWHADTGRCLQTLAGHDGAVRAAAIAADGRWALSGGEDGTLRMWDLVSEGKQQVVAEGLGAVCALAVTLDGRRAVIGTIPSLWQGGLQHWDLSSGFREHELLAGTDQISSAAITPDGRLAVSMDSRGTLRLWDLPTGRQLRALPTASGNCVAIAADGHRAVTGGSDGNVCVWNVYNGVAAPLAAEAVGRSVGRTTRSRDVGPHFCKCNPHPSCLLGWGLRMATPWAADRTIRSHWYSPWR